MKFKVWGLHHLKVVSLRSMWGVARMRGNSKIFILWPECKICIPNQIAVVPHVFLHQFPGNSNS
jgi:hypothetical protein